MIIVFKILNIAIFPTLVSILLLFFGEIAQAGNCKDIQDQSYLDRIKNGNLISRVESGRDHRMNSVVGVGKFLFRINENYKKSGTYYILMQSNLIGPIEGKKKVLQVKFSDDWSPEEINSIVEYRSEVFFHFLVDKDQVSERKATVVGSKGKELSLSYFPVIASHCDKNLFQRLKTESKRYRVGPGVRLNYLEMVNMFVQKLTSYQKKAGEDGEIKKAIIKLKKEKLAVKEWIRIQNLPKGTKGKG